jgi:ATP-dependent exoDNAse (exonuclease V) alpha subunit
MRACVNVKLEDFASSSIIALGTLKAFDPDGRVTLRMDSGKDVSFDPQKMPHFDHGYAVTSQSVQGLTSQHVWSTLIRRFIRAHQWTFRVRLCLTGIARCSDLY